MEVLCKVIPLFKVTVTHEEERRGSESHEDVIISDNVVGLIMGLVDLELDYEMDLSKCDKKFEVTDFLLMPCAGAVRGYHLFDIDNVDAGEWYGASIDAATFYRCYFKGDGNKHDRDMSRNEDRIFAEPEPVMEPQEQPHTPHDYEKARLRWDEEEAYMNALYRVSKEHPYRAERDRKENEKREKLEQKAMKKIKKEMKKNL